MEQVEVTNPARRASIGAFLRRNAKRYPDRNAIVVPASPSNPKRRAITYAELNATANRIANHLSELGLKRGDVMAFMGRNCPEHFATFYACQKLGIATTGVNYTFKPTEITYQLSHSGAKAVIVEDQFVPKVEEVIAEVPTLAIRIVNETYGDTASQDWIRYGQLASSGSEQEPDSEVFESDLAILPYTSGTEALPKAVMVPHRNYLMSMIPSYITGMGLTEDDVHYYVLPFHTIAGMGLQIALISLANTLVLPIEWTPADALDSIADEGVTNVGQTPTFYLQLINLPGFAEKDLSKLRRAVTYGGTMPQAMFDAFAKTSPDLLWLTLWSQSELTQTPTIGRFRSLADIPNGDVAWIGRPTSQLEVRVVDENDQDVDADIEGELICRSPGVMLGYFNNPEKTASVMRNGWLHTGDLVRHDGKGNIFFVDRQKDVIKSGGMNVSSVEVERTCYQFPGVVEVAVVGVADEYWSQAVTAFVVAKADAPIEGEALIAHCKERLAPFKVPKNVRFVDALPKDSQGKILKRELRRQAEEEAQAKA